MSLLKYSSTIDYSHVHKRKEKKEKKARDIKKNINKIIEKTQIRNLKHKKQVNF